MAYNTKSDKMKTLQLTEEEIRIIKNALFFAYDKKLDIVKNNRKILGDENSKRIISEANKYFDVAEKVLGKL